jgi:hypothetical protein
MDRNRRQTDEQSRLIGRIHISDMNYCEYMSKELLWIGRSIYYDQYTWTLTYAKSAGIFYGVIDWCMAWFKNMIDVLFEMRMRIHV